MKEYIAMFLLLIALATLVVMATYSIFKAGNLAINYNYICAESSKIVKLEDIASRPTSYVYKLENGQRVESFELYQDGQEFCTEHKYVRK